jgi:hypothetical protein
MKRRHLIAVLAGSAAGLAATGALIAIAETRGPVFIAGDQPVTEDQVRTKLAGDDYLDVRIVREGQFFEATGAKAGKTTKLRIDSRTGRLATDDDDDDD